MRIVISAPRKSGGAHLRCLLSMAYDLKAPPVSAPEHGGPDAIASWIAELPPRSVSTCDLPRAVLAGPAAATDVHLIGIIRHPFDLFVSNYDVAQQRAARGRDEDEGNRNWDILSGTELESEVAQQYAAGEFANEVSALRDWDGSGTSVRFEDLLTDAAAVLGSLANSLAPLTAESIDHAVGLCPAENVVLSRPGRGRRMPLLPPGAWRDRIPGALLAKLRERSGADVSALGYDVY